MPKCSQVLTSFLSLIPQSPELLSCPIRLFWAEKCIDRVSFRMFNLACSCRVCQIQILTFFWVRGSWKDSGSQCHDMHAGIHLLPSEMILQVETSTYSPTSFQHLQSRPDFALPQFSGFITCLQPHLSSHLFPDIINNKSHFLLIHHDTSFIGVLCWEIRTENGAY